MDDWIECKKYPGYFVNKNGDVKGLRKDLLKGSLQKSRGGSFYKVVRIGHSGPDIRVHCLVAEAFIPNPNNKPEIDHINRNSLDNRVENLRWVTRSENQINKRIPKNNTTGRKNLYYISKKDTWTIIIHRNFKRHQLYFKTKEEAEEYLDGLDILDLMSPE